MNQNFLDLPPKATRVAIIKEVTKPRPAPPKKNASSSASPPPPPAAETPASAESVNVGEVEKARDGGVFIVKNLFGLEDNVKSFVDRIVIIGEKVEEEGAESSGSVKAKIVGAFGKGGKCKVLCEGSDVVKIGDKVILL